MKLEDLVKKLIDERFEEFEKKFKRLKESMRDFDPETGLRKTHVRGKNDEHND